MNIDKVSKVSEFAKYRESLHIQIQLIELWNTQTQQKEWQKLEYFESLNALKVTSASLFSDDIWDFNDDYKNSSAYVKGSKLRINFGNYENINKFVIYEIKAAFYLYINIPGILKEEGKKTTKKNIKPNSAITKFESGLRFIESLHNAASSTLGREYVMEKYYSLKMFDKHLYQEAAKNHNFVFDSSLNQFFDIMKSSALRELIFDGAIPNINLKELPWNKLGGNRQEKKKVLDNFIFEKASLISSLNIVDFLDAMGEVVVDTGTLQRRNAKGHHPSISVGINRDLFNLYIFKRLKSKGYGDSIIIDAACVTSEELYSERKSGALISQRTLDKLTDHRLNYEFRDYLNSVNYSCLYIIAQYSGMRPSELAEINVHNCLQEDGGFYVIKSRVSKHKDNLISLFDDAWVAIPIMRDAIKAAQILSRYKQNPYLYSNVSTVSPQENPKPLGANGLQYQMKEFFHEFMSNESMESVEFNAYMLRHTLAYQLYRAELGLPFISHQLKHFGDLVGRFGQNKGFSATSLAYGEIADILSKSTSARGVQEPLKHMAETESVKSFFDPDANYAGINAENHKERLSSVFKGYMSAGYSKDQIFDAMAAQGIAIVNVGQGYCYGGSSEEFDESLPCIGSLRCNPNRCKNAVITELHAPKWREIYMQNLIILDNPDYAHNREQIVEAMKEAKGVLEYLGLEV